MKKHLLLCALLACALAQAFEYTLRSGDYDVRITARFKHTIRSISYKGTLLATPSGYYGAIVIPRPGKFIGTGHTQGGEEALLDCRVECDGVRVEPAKDAVLAGGKLSVEKVSRYDNVLMRCRLELTPQGLVETKRFITVAPQDFYLFYAHIYCFNQAMTDYCALAADGRLIVGKFLKQKRQWHVNTEVKYVAEYDDATKKGALLYYPQVIPGMVRKATIWEVVKGYNKFYQFAKVPPSVPAGWQSPVYTVCLRGFEAPGADALPAAAKAAAEAAAKIPVPEIAAPAP